MNFLDFKSCGTIRLHVDNRPKSVEYALALRAIHSADTLLVHVGEACQAGKHAVALAPHLLADCAANAGRANEGRFSLELRVRFREAVVMPVAPTHHRLEASALKHLALAGNGLGTGTLDCAAAFAWLRAGSYNT